MLLSDKYPFLTNFFEKSIENSKLAHSILLYGNDLDSQYTLALEIARLLNCSENKSDTCQCLNCKWIREGSHPAVLTISKKDNKPEDDSSKTVISMKQAELVRNSIVLSSDYHRVFIFCDRDDNGKIKGLNKFNLQEPVANSLLKSIEEPNPNITFIFLTQDKSDLISTIISRCQCFFVPSKIKTEYNFNLIEGILKNYWSIPRIQAFDISKKLVELLTDNDSSIILEQIQNYMLSILKSNPTQIQFIDNIRAVEKAKTEINIGMKPETVFDELCLNIIK
jgi:DNA polymerase III delta prime subunit